MVARGDVPGPALSSSGDDATRAGEEYDEQRVRRPVRRKIEVRTSTVKRAGVDPARRS